MDKLQEALRGLQSQIALSQPLSVSSEASYNPQPKQEVAAPVKQSYGQEERANIVKQLGACLVVQRTYGKQGADMNSMAAVFMSDLQEYPADKVVQALAQWRKQSAEFPTPADIIGLLNPQPIWSAAVYAEISDRRKKGEILSLREEEYIKGYKKQAMKGL
jgi:hypothetical protein